MCDFVPSCAGHSDGFYLDRTKPNCQSYIQCQDNRVANQSRCPYGQRFNRNIGRCASADQVPCRGKYKEEFDKNTHRLILFLASSLFSSIYIFILLIASTKVL